ncbi:hypothetical protein LOK49_LG02G02688 [Camellia lanceoleosa]|uniref:Uncharacterized protein n=1 Tax=Camellia lanceoleosa TaxID=1840588 RepID=A0ACC0IP61_9ERIC|nr:hypothetical protein LOK49_LG02G02688 [Camellia lanceoleosa]
MHQHYITAAKTLCTSSNMHPTTYTLTPYSNMHLTSYTFTHQHRYAPYIMHQQTNSRSTSTNSPTAVELKQTAEWQNYTLTPYSRTAEQQNNNKQHTSSHPTAE